MHWQADPIVSVLRFKECGALRSRSLPEGGLSPDTSGKPDWELVVKDKGVLVWDSSRRNLLRGTSRCRQGLGEPPYGVTLTPNMNALLGSSHRNSKPQGQESGVTWT